MAERSGVITMKGQPLTLMGPELKVGEAAPDFEATGTDLTPFRFSSLKGQVCLLAAAKRRLPGKRREFFMNPQPILLTTDLEAADHA